MKRDVDEFGEMLKEAFVGEEPFDPRPAPAALEGSIDKFERRMRTVRHMAWFGVSFMGAVMVLAAVMFFRAPADAGAKTFILWAAVFFWGLMAVGMIKAWFAMMHNDIGLRKELKRTQLMILGAREGGR
jgi:small-conductance mechanosensitive channel